MTARQDRMLTQTQDNEEIIARVAALDIGKSELVCWCGSRTRTARAGGCRR